MSSIINPLPSPLGEKNCYLLWHWHPQINRSWRPRVGSWTIKLPQVIPRVSNLQTHTTYQVRPPLLQDSSPAAQLNVTWKSHRRAATHSPNLENLWRRCLQTLSCSKDKFYIKDKESIKKHLLHEEKNFLEKKIATWQVKNAEKKLIFEWLPHFPRRKEFQFISSKVKKGSNFCFFL